MVVTDKYSEDLESATSFKLVQCHPPALIGRVELNPFGAKSNFMYTGLLHQRALNLALVQNCSALGPSRQPRFLQVLPCHHLPHI